MGSLLSSGLGAFGAPGRVILACIVAAPEGTCAVNREFPETEILTASLDRQLSDRKYILPGLGDFGDRLYGTFQA